jgi:hypothetical protein
MIFKSQIMTQASGSIGGTTFSHAKGGVMYQRARAIPVNPSSTYQVQIRNIVSGLASFWASALTQAQRDTWDMYAQNVPVTNKLGDSITLSGQNWFIGANTLIGQLVTKLTLTVAPITSAPTTFDRGTQPIDGVPTYSEASGLSLVFDDSQSWVDEDDAFLLIFQGRPRGAGRNFFKGPWRLVGVIAGDSVTPPSSPFVIGAAQLTILGWTVTEGENVATRVVLLRADGRYSSGLILPSDIVGA